ncbi:type II secretion system minor pseudopilin GspI [Ampullimonas aquatilis]|uniref:type II secretion system minor pseudopilin GspI n=1 Tax=Ampullimonas aquatilis TaxID=1341549 RepID=UPI003C731DF3
MKITRGFTLIEVLVALTIVGVAMIATLRAAGNLTRNTDALRMRTLASVSAENRLVQMRLLQEFPPIGQRSTDCPQGELNLICEEEIKSTPNPNFRRVEVSVYNAEHTERLVKLIHVVVNAPR